jgi:hypothetical protein
MMVAATVDLIAPALAIVSFFALRSAGDHTDYTAKDRIKGLNGLYLRFARAARKMNHVGRLFGPPTVKLKIFPAPRAGETPQALRLRPPHGL